ncbi:hypothetical protein Tco_1499177 [Tanacetum coccineum]
MLGKTQNKLYDLFLKAGLGYENPERLKKAIAAQKKCMMVKSFINLKELKEELIVEVQEMLNIFESMEQKVDRKSSKGNILQTEIDRLLEVSLTSEIRDGVLLSFDKSEALPLPKNIAIKAKKLSNSKVNADRSKPVTSHPTPNNEQGVESSNSVRRQKSKDTKLKNRVLKNTNAKSSIAHVRKMSRSVSIYSNKCETRNSTLCHANKSVLNTKNVTAVNDGSNIVCVSCGKDVFLLSHEKCVARYALSRNSNVKRALFTTPIAAKSKNLRATSIVAKSRLGVAKTPIATNKVSSALPLFPDSSQSRTLSNYMKNKIATSRKWKKWFEYQQSFNWIPKSKTAQSLLSETKSRDPTRPLDC